jgi:hypothetical protein
MEKVLETVTKLIEEEYVIGEEILLDHGKEFVIYHIYDKTDPQKITQKATIQLSMDEEATVANYLTNNHWFEPSETKTEPAIQVRWLESNQKGLGSLMLAYGVLKMKKKHPHVHYSVLDDDSDQSLHITKNIYSKFGYSPTEAVTRVENNKVELKGPEKQVLMTEFIENAAKLFPSRGRRRVRATRSRAASRVTRSRTASRSRAASLVTRKRRYSRNKTKD